MADETTSGQTERFHILRGPDQAIYMVSEANLNRHRVSDEVLPALLKAYAPQVDAANRKAGPADASAFRILATGSMPARFGSDLEPIDTWVDTM